MNSLTLSIPSGGSARHARRIMQIIRRFAAGLMLGLVSASGSSATEPVKAFTPDWDSLKQYQCPEWFRDAKFGIWSHWGPQSVPMSGDWYARHLYTPDHGQYQHHLENYGHPSEQGFKDIIPQWKAEKWDPERLMTLYKDAGAKYFVSMGVHHDNFDLWNSKHQEWNAVKMGPKRDVVGEWQKVAKKHGLRFGVSEHLGASYTWWAASKGSDKAGPKAGVPYDGANPQFADLYHPLPAPDDTGWYSTNPQWHAEWSKRIHDLVETYQPDLLYSDGGLPFGLTGRTLLANFYNANMAAHGGKLEAVYNCKSHHGNSENNQFVAESCVHDMERGVQDGIQPLPWQTDTSIGDWFYNKTWKYQPVSWTIHMLVDIVSKNGNLLLNVVQRPDGSLDPEVEQALVELAAWNKIHGEAIYGTRPWKIFGEGPVKAAGGSFKEKFDYSSKDIRFTTKGATLYAIALGWPEDGKLVIRSLDKSASVKSVAVLGSAATAQWSLTDAGLEVTLPAAKISPHTVAVRIEGENLRPAASSISAAGGDELMERLPRVFERAAVQYEGMLEKVEMDPKLPRTLRGDGSVLTVKPEDWTSGFFPGNLWLLHEYDQSPKWKDKALAYTRRLEVIRHFKGNHDGGFMLGCSYGNALRLDPSDEHRSVLRDAAAALGTRFIPELGMIRSWDHQPFTCPVIIDNMMNLELLTWAARNGGDPKLREIAVSHADKTLQQHFRPDGSAYHVVDYDPRTGWIRAIHGWQGADVRTPWARGQSWALYGFTMMFRETGKPEYLEQAAKLARFLMNHPNMPGDRVPSWDYGLKPGDGVPRDASAAAVMASALLELAQLSKDGAEYRDYAVKQLLSLSSAPYLADAGSNGGFILTRSTGYLPGNSEIDVPLVYADYYFLEALLRYRAMVKGEKRLSFGEAR